MLRERKDEFHRRSNHKYHADEERDPGDLRNGLYLDTQSTFVRSIHSSFEVAADHSLQALYSTD